LQVLQLIIFAGLAAVVLYQLYAVLGRRVGRQPGEQPAVEPAAGAPRLAERGADAADEDVQLTGLAAIRARDPGFDVNQFLGGAKQAYGMIVKAFAEGDKPTLRSLLGPEVFTSFEAVIDQRQTEGVTETVEFLHAPRADLDGAKVNAGDVAQVTVRFLAEFRSRTKGPEGEAVDDRRTAELWTFERPLKNRDPNWTLIHVDAAEA
jgi:predicted lipid-binding transport protein (Tim44 family)